jgi:hypothetical protein
MNCAAGGAQAVSLNAGWTGYCFTMLRLGCSRRHTWHLLRSFSQHGWQYRLEGACTDIICHSRARFRQVTRPPSPGCDSDPAGLFTRPGMRSVREMDHTAESIPHVTICAVSTEKLQYGVIVQSINELLKLFMRQARLERAMKPLGGARFAAERKAGGALQYS